jgi:N-acetylmuramoyl-L-alanine amidase
MSKIFVGIGHGLKSTGTFDPGSVSSDGSVTEYEQNRIIAEYLTRFLRAAEHDVQSEADMINKTDPNYPGSIAAANSWPADFAIEIHRDWSSGIQEQWPIMYASGGRAEKTSNAIIESAAELGVPTRPASVQNLAFVRETSMPALIVENGRVGQEIDFELWARSLAEGICKEWGGTVPVTVEGSAVWSFPIDDATAGETLAQIEAGVKALQAAPAPVTVISDADILKIATAVANLLAARLVS